jgi:hypothetical protein
LVVLLQKQDVLPLLLGLVLVALALCCFRRYAVSFLISFRKKGYPFLAKLLLFPMNNKGSKDSRKGR